MAQRFQPYLGKQAAFFRGGGVSLATLSALNKGSFLFLGSVNRYVEYKDKAVVNSSFQSFLSSKKVNLKENYVYCSANVKAELPSVAKYDLPQPVLNELNWRKADSWARRHFHMCRGSSEVTLDTVMAEMDKTTSPGYPWTLRYANKLEFFIKGEKDFREYVQRCYDEASKIHLYPKGGYFWTSSVKAEMRPKEKAEQNKLRTFCASPVELTALSNMMCLDFNRKFYEAGSLGTCWSAVGMSKYNLGWDRLGKRLNRHKRGFALDVSAYDSNLFQRALYEVGEFRIDAGNYHGEAANRVRHVYREIVNSMMVLTNGDVVEKSTGNPSGSGNTVVDNTYQLFKLLAYTWLETCPPGMDEYEEFMRCVEAALYGDDNTFTVSEEVIEWFNARAVERVLGSLGIKVTAENDIWEPQTLDKLVFLGQGFRPYRSKWVPVPESSKTLCSLMFGSDIDDVRWQLMRAQALYQESFWNETTRAVLGEYKHFIYSQYRTKLVGDEVAKGIKLKDILANNKSDEQIRALYLASETNTQEAFKFGQPPLSSLSISEDAWVKEKYQESA